MYCPSLFAETRQEELHRIIQTHPLGVLVTHTPAGLDANHLPFLLEEQGTVLHAHVARANPVWKNVSDGDEVLVIFRGVEGYISPNWYPSKQETHRHVPTWNYEVAHVHGRIQVRDDERFVRGVVAKLTRQHESAQPQPWKMGDAPADYIAEQLQQIVGIEIDALRFEGKRKLSQNRSKEDFEGTVCGLSRAGRGDLASTMMTVVPTIIHDKR
jgi:transcriptional regulator